MTRLKGGKGNKYIENKNRNDLTFKAMKEPAYAYLCVWGDGAYNQVLVLVPDKT